MDNLYYLPQNINNSQYYSCPGLNDYIIIFNYTTIKLTTQVQDSFLFIFNVLTSSMKKTAILIQYKMLKVNYLKKILKTN